MIPPVVGADSPPGERELFQRLRTDKGTEDWVVFHSLDISTHVRQVQGESDFVVLIPGRGIAVVEVKSHIKIERRADGMWLLGSQVPSSRSPFRQANEAKFSIRNHLDKSGIGVQDLLLESFVWFTSTRARAQLSGSVEWSDWQLLDLDDLSDSVAVALGRSMNGAKRHLEAKVPGNRGLLVSSIPAIVQTLRPNFELASTDLDLRRDRNTQLRVLLEDQYVALDAMIDNVSTVFSGPAGSGKTFLALEASRREGLLGHSGWLICYNRLLGIDFEEKAVGSVGIDANSLNRLLLNLTGIEVPHDPPAEFWSDDLPNAAIELLLNEDLAREFLIVDEAQDLVSEKHLDVLDLLVRGGLSNGRCIFFGDFDRQAIFANSDSIESLTDRMPHAPRYRLTDNCRNVPLIGALVVALGKLVPPYRRFRRTDDGVEPRRYWYKNQLEQSKKLQQAIQDLRGEDFAFEDIVILSMKRSQAIAARIDAKWLQHRLIPATHPNATANKIRYTTVHAFKGLESPAVILTDIDDINQPGLDDLLYIGLSRATDRLAIVAEKSVISEIFLR